MVYVSNAYGIDDHLIDLDNITYVLSPLFEYSISYYEHTINISLTFKNLWEWSSEGISVLRNGSPFPARDAFWPRSGPLVILRRARHFL